jgi:hypothetical protein
MSIVPTTEREGPTVPDWRAALTIRSSSALTLRRPPTAARALSQVTLSASRVTEMGHRGMNTRYHMILI